MFLKSKASFSVPRGTGLPSNMIDLSRHVSSAGSDDHHKVPKRKSYETILSKSWSPRPKDISFSGSLWFDLAVVGVLYRLEEFYSVNVAHSFDGAWLPYFLLLGIYDTWEIPILKQTEFTQKYFSGIHAVLSVLLWLCLAMMGASIPYKYTGMVDAQNMTINGFQWDPYDQSVFAYMKLISAITRCLLYLDIVLFSKQKRASRLGMLRLCQYFLGMLPLIAIPILIAYGVSASFWSILLFISFVLQHVSWNIVIHIWPPEKFQPNIPFLLWRLRDWIQLQLGAAVIGIITNVDLSTNAATKYGLAVTGYFFLATLDFLSYSSAPEVFHDHAIVVGGLRATSWLFFFFLFTLCVLGIAVGLRYFVQHPTLPGVPTVTAIIWLLTGSSILSIICILMQEINHTTTKVMMTRRRVWLIKFFLSLTCIIAPPILIFTDAGDLFYIVLNFAISTMLVLIVHALNGGFRRIVSQKTTIKFIAYIHAIIIARAWLQRARDRIRERNEANNNDNNSSAAPQVRYEKKKHSLPRKDVPVHIIEDENEVAKNTKDYFRESGDEEEAEPMKKTESPESGEAAPESYSNQKDDETEEVMQSEGLQEGGFGVLPPETNLGPDEPFEPLNDETALPRRRVSGPNFSTRSRNSDAMGSRRSRAASMLRDLNTSVRKRFFPTTESLTIKPKNIRLIKKVINDHFYEKPHLLVEHDVFAAFNLSWSDLFLDIIFIGVLYRLGAYLGHGFNLGSSYGHAVIVPTTIYLYGCLAYAILNLWWVKVSFSSKVGVSDVFHKVIDVLQGLLVLLSAINITSPQDFQETQSNYVLAITSSLTLYHITMCFLWFEVRFRADDKSRKCADRNLVREVLSIFSLYLAFLSWGLKGPLEITSLFWGLSWLFPMLHRLFTINCVKEDEKVPFLLNYVLHRQADGALLLLGEGIFQIIRAVSATTTSGVFWVFSLSFLNMTAARIAIFQMDVFDEHAKKHAVLFSRLYHVIITFIRQLFSPAIVSMGVSLKYIVDSANYDVANDRYCTNQQTTFSIFGVSNLLTLGSFFTIYHLHRYSYYKTFRKYHYLFGLLISSCFLIFPWIPCISNLAITGGSLGIWAIAIVFHSITDDLFNKTDRNDPVDHSIPRIEANQINSLAIQSIAKNSRNLVRNLKNKGGPEMTENFIFQSSRNLLSDLRHRGSSVSSVTKAFLSASPSLSARRRMISTPNTATPLLQKANAILTELSELNLNTSQRDRNLDGLNMSQRDRNLNGSQRNRNLQDITENIQSSGLIGDDGDHQTLNEIDISPHPSPFRNQMNSLSHNIEATEADGETKVLSDLDMI